MVIRWLLQLQSSHQWSKKQKRRKRKGQKKVHVYDCVRPFQRSFQEFQSHPKAYAYISLAIFAAKDAEKYSFINGFYYYIQ